MSGCRLSKGGSGVSMTEGAVRSSAKTHVSPVRADSQASGDDASQWVTAACESACPPELGNTTVMGMVHSC